MAEDFYINKGRHVKNVKDRQKVSVVTHFFYMFSVKNDLCNITLV